MSLISKSDVKNHLSTRTGASGIPIQPVSQPDATGYSGDGSEDAAVNATHVDIASGDSSSTTATEMTGARVVSPTVGEKPVL
jgi:hypothetical protein